MVPFSLHRQAEFLLGWAWLPCGPSLLVSPPTPGVYLCRKPFPAAGAVEITQPKTEGNVSICCIYFVMILWCYWFMRCTFQLFQIFFCQVLGSLPTWALRSLVILSPFVRDTFQGCMQNLISFFGEEFTFFVMLEKRHKLKVLDWY